MSLDVAFDAAMKRARHPDAEAAVLGGCFVQPETLDWLELDRDAFFDARNRHVWDAMQSLRGDGVVVDETTVASVLRKAGFFDFVGEGYLAQLGLRVPTVSGVEHYAAILREHLVNRRLLQLAGSVPSRFSVDMSGEELLGDVQSALSAIDPCGPETGESVASAVDAELEEVKRFLQGSGGHVGIPTGIKTLDQRIGGVIVGAPTILGARPGEGKSTFALNIANHAAKNGHGVHLFTYEDRSRTFAQRQLAYASGVPVDRIRARQFMAGDLERIGAAKGTQPKNIEIEHGHGMPAEAVIRRVRGRRKALGTKLVIVDYVQLMPSPDRTLKRYQAIGANMKSFVELAGKDDVAVLVLSQLNRESAREKRAPVMEDLRDSGELEQDAKLILALHSKNREAPTVEVHVLKNHQGPPAVFDISYDRPRCRMG